VAIRDDRYGEVVGAFLRAEAQASCITPNIDNRPTWSAVNNFVRKSLGSHKAPKYVFWLGEAGCPETWPVTGSGKIMKHVLRSIGERLVQDGKGGAAEAAVRARL
jgi:mevalonyl-CoA ligase